MKVFNLVIFSIATLGLFVACDKGGRGCAVPGCNTNAGILYKKCEATRGTDRGFSFEKLNSQVRSKAKGSNGNIMARRVLVDFQAQGNDFQMDLNKDGKPDQGNQGLFIGQTLGANGNLTRLSLISDMTYEQLTENSDKAFSNSFVKIKNCGTFDGLQKPLAAIREGEGVITELSPQSITVELGPASLAELNADRDPLNKIQNYTVQVERVVSADSSVADKAEQAGQTEIKRTTTIKLQDMVLAAALVGAKGDAQKTTEVMLANKLGKLPKAEPRGAVITEVTTTDANMENIRMAKISANLLRNLVAANGNKKCRITLSQPLAERLDDKEIKKPKAVHFAGVIKVDMSTLEQLDDNLQEFLATGTCSSGYQDKELNVPPDIPDLEVRP